ncbi:MAG TPA: lysophospholipid acyltransferase family protein [Spirochaetota bacterium]|nr:lysophospholipid acyltransferase family protein [Spirochaetota bacterium]HOL56307.1 lysophospholipid acyltransferase family protein [Spirochaetota bacterium]HPP03348.1 lysophospholipid acyltransferase family protein [Spirochaetota bacterium]
MIIINLIFSFFAGIFTLILSLIFFLLTWWLIFIPRNKRAGVARYVLINPWTFIFNYFILFIRLKTIGKENVDTKRVTLYICNHQSWADIPVVVPKTKATALSKKEVVAIPLVGFLTVLAGGIFFDRDEQSSRMAIIKDLIDFFKNGYSLCYFPEGTRSKDGALLEPNLALVKLAFKLKIAVVPIAVEGTKNVIQKGRIYYKFFQRVVLKFGKPVLPENFKNDTEFATYCWEMVKNIHTEIKEKYFNK